MGVFALFANTSGTSNIAIGDSALVALTSGSFNTVIGDAAGGDLADGSDNIYIGATAAATPTPRPRPTPAPRLSGASSESGTIRIGAPISACFVAGISGVAVSGNPVCIDGNGQLGECGPGASPVSLNELLKEQKKIEEQQATIAELKSTVEILTAQLRENAAQIQKANAQFEMNKPAAKVVVNKP
jgi:hypothetical protein